MSLRPELQPPAVDPAQLEALCVEIDRITEILESGGDADEDIVAFNATTGHTYGPADFWHYWEHRRVEEFALEAARPAPGRDPAMTPEELVEIVRLVLAGGGDAAFYLALFRANVARPQVIQQVIHQRDLTTEQDAERIVREALAG